MRRPSKRHTFSLTLILKYSSSTSGGLLTHRLLQAGVFDILKNEYLDQQHDGAFLELHGKVAFSTDSYVISPIFFPGGNIGELSVNGSVNDLAMCGAVPKYLSLSFIIEEGLRMEDFWEILLGIKLASDKAGGKDCNRGYQGCRTWQR